MKIYLVGGAVRDRLLGIKPVERDWMVVGATDAEMRRRGYRRVGRDFPVYLHPDDNEQYALARRERKSGHGYTGFVCETGDEVTLEDDLRRRDLTINAIAEDAEHNLIDPYGGQLDLQRRLLRHVSPAFSEDPLRVLRVARFAARFAPLGFTVAPETMTLMQQMSASGELDYLVAERVWSETERARSAQPPRRNTCACCASAARSRWCFRKSTNSLAYRNRHVIIPRSTPAFMSCCAWKWRHDSVCRQWRASRC